MEDKGMGYWLGASFFSLGYILYSIVIWFNKDNLDWLKIDSNFVIISIIVGAIITFSLPIIFGIPMGLVTLFNYRTCLSGELKFQNVPKKWWYVLTLIAVSLLPPAFGIWWSGSRITFPGYAEILQVAINNNFQQAFFEEFVFRGMVWMFLIHFNLKDKPIIFLQALLFWLFHHFYISSRPITFWIYLPIQSIIYGIIVSRTKSITPVFVAHFINNIVVTLVN
jgi:membrane protease YdiL (CAAX protease family)